MTLQIVRSRIPVLSVAGAERADVAWGFVHEAVADHLVFALEAFAAGGAGAALDWAVVRAGLGVDVCMGAGGELVSVGAFDWVGKGKGFIFGGNELEQVLRLEGCGGTAGVIAFEAACSVSGDVCDLWD